MRGHLKESTYRDPLLPIWTICFQKFKSPLIITYNDYRKPHIPTY